MWFWKRKKTPVEPVSPSKLEPPLAQMRALRAKLWDPASRFSVSATLEEVEEIAAQLRDDPDAAETRAEIAYAKGYLYGRDQQFEQSSEGYEAALAHHAQTPFLPEKTALSARMGIAFNAADLGDWQKAIATMDAVLPDIAASTEYGDNQYYGCKERMAYWLHEIGDFAAARDLNAEVIAFGEAEFSTDAPELMVALTNLAQNHHALSDPDAARPVLERTLAIARKCGDIDKQQDMMFQLAVLSFEQGAVEETETQFIAAKAHADETQDDWLIKRAAENLGSFYQKRDGAP